MSNNHLNAACLNCGSNLQSEDRFCSQCGQQNRPALLPVRSLISSLFQDYFTVDSKFFRSITRLGFRPGALTNAFNSGKRTSFIMPFRLYLFISFVHFFVLALSLSDTDQEVSGLINIEIGEDELPMNEAGIESATTEREMGRLESFLREKEMLINEDPRLFRQALFKSASITMFFMLPVFAFLLYLFHFRVKPYYVEHLVMSVHFHSFVFMVLTILLLIEMAFGMVMRPALLLIAALYFVLAIKNVYRQSWWAAIFKSLGIAIFYLIALLVGIIIMLAGAMVSI